MRESFIQTLTNEAKNDENIVLITGDLGFGILDNFQKELPNQFINSGIKHTINWLQGYDSSILTLSAKKNIMLDLPIKQ